MNMWYFYLLLSVLTTNANCDERLVVNTALGPVLGTSWTTLAGVDFFKFEGIPYAKPPLGDLRFRPPEPAEPWTDILVADRRVFCIQSTMAGSVIGSEDCLHVHVSVPKQTSKVREPLPVFVTIHGGAFQFGSGNEHFLGASDYFMNKDVITVSINYRVGPFGFLSTEDEHAPGNYGLLDQLAGLKWIQNNIASFGGNPNEVTICGVSAGGASVLYQVLSPLSKGLFHRAIPMSGTPINPWPRTRIAIKSAQHLAEKVGCPSDSSSDLLKCLRNKDATDILAVSSLTGKQRWGLSPYVWLPRVDTEAKSPFLPREPIDMMASGDFNRVPMVIGFTRDEGLWLYPTFPCVTEEDIQLMATDWQRVCDIGVLNSEEFEVLKQEATALCDKIRKFYISPENINNVYHQKYIDLLGAAFFTSGIQKTAELMHKFTPTYLYSFDFFSKKTNLMRRVNHKDVPLLGVQHADDLLYLYNFSMPEMLESPEKEVVDMLTSLYTNFAKHGLPVFANDEIQWPKFEFPDFKYVSLNYPPSVQQKYREKEMKFWEDIFASNWYKQETTRKDEL